MPPLFISRQVVSVVKRNASYYNEPEAVMEDKMRMRRMRSNEVLRKMCAEVGLEKRDFIYPLFLVEGEKIRKEISGFPGVYHLSVDEAVKEIGELLDLGIEAVLLFGLPAYKDEVGSSGYAEDGIVQKALRAMKKAHPRMLLITDVCLCEYTSHGHCGLLDECGEVLNDESCELLAKVALSHARAGADMVAPSDMMDHRVRYIREALDQEGFIHLPIMAYSAKYASSYYGPFREAAQSAPSFGNRKSYQMDYHNSDEAMREIELDLEEGADLVIIKPAMAYLDILQRAKDRFDIPLVAYQVSGEYSMLKLAVEQGVFSEEVIYESLIAIKRAGAKMIISYFAKELAKQLP